MRNVRWHDYTLLLLLLVLGALQFSWVFWPELGFYWGAGNALAVVGIICVGLGVRATRRNK